jgi:hypothetical protein
MGSMMAVRRTALIALGVVSLVRPLRAEEIALPPSVESALESGRFASTPVGFRMMALSFIADACAREGVEHAALAASARRCVERAYRRALALERAHGDLAVSGLWLTHVNLILGAAHRVGPCLDEERHGSLSRTLRRRSLADPNAHAPSYSSVRARWPADQSATLASLARYDRAHGEHLVNEPLARFREVLDRRGTRRDLDLPYSEIAGATRTGRQPRGCALAYETLYLDEADPARARRYWEAFKRHYLVERVALVGFREWPPGFDGQSDSDSGPIVHGVGAAATAFAIPAARAMGDRVLAARLRATAAVVERAARFSPALARVAHGTLADAIRMLGE